MANNPRNLRPPLTSTYDFLNYYAESKKKKGESVFCFQVGANDGKTNDPVHKFFQDYAWKGLLVEPQYDVFHGGLTKTYSGNKNVILENVALAKTSGELPFFRVAISRARWATGLSSFDRKSLEGHIENGYIQRKAKDEGVEVPEDKSKLIETVTVPTMRVEDLFFKHQVESFQILCVDTEGFDFEILKLINFKKFKPEVVFFESKNLSDADFVEAKKYLVEEGFELFWEHGDTLAIRYPYPWVMKVVNKVKAAVRKF